jgi:hypothetical protein
LLLKYFTLSPGASPAKHGQSFKSERRRIQAGSNTHQRHLVQPSI